MKKVITSSLNELINDTINIVFLEFQYSEFPPPSTKCEVNLSCEDLDKEMVEAPPEEDPDPVQGGSGDDAEGPEVPDSKSGIADQEEYSEFQEFYEFPELMSESHFSKRRKGNKCN